jgi:predicted nucleic-acid-binding Zn-ribbon protein
MFKFKMVELFITVITIYQIFYSHIFRKKCGFNEFYTKQINLA